MGKGTSVLLTIVSGAAGAAIGAGVTNHNLQKKIDYYEKRVEKFKTYFDLTNEWLRLKNEGKTLSEYFEKNQWKHIAIYGMGELGNRLLEELRGSSVVVDYAIDKHTDKVYSEVDVKEISEGLPEVDVIVITPIYAYDEVEEMLMDAVDYPIVSIEDVVFNS